MEVLAFALYTMNLTARPPIEAADDHWSGAVNFNASAATGNTDNTVIGGDFRIARAFDTITHLFEAAGNYAETTQTFDGDEVSEVTQNRFFAQYRLEVQTGERSFLYGRTRYGEDQFSGFDRQAFIGGGIGRTFADNERMRLQVLAGPGVQYFERTRAAGALPTDEEDSETTAALFIGETFSYVLRENVSFEQSFDATLANSNSLLSGLVSLKTDLTDKISSRISYSVIHNTEPPEGREETDTLLTASIGYEF